MHRLLAILVLAAACGGDDGGGTLTPGTYRLVGETVNGAVTPAAQLDGALELTATEYGLGIARPAPQGVVAAYTVAGGELVLSGGGGRVDYSVEGDRLELRPDADRVWTFEPFTPTAAETFAVTGTVEIARGAPPMTSPHAALVHYNREGGEVVLAHDPRDDQALSLDGGIGTFDLSRTRPALGTDRIPMGTTAGISIALVVVYDDRDGGGLTSFFAPCATTSGDCIRGMSTIVLASRDGTSAELSSSPYALLRRGWSNAVQVTDQRSGELGLASADEKTLTHAITVLVDPSGIAAPGFQL
jgi:hypothetical protein